VERISFKNIILSLILCLIVLFAITVFFNIKNTEIIMVIVSIYYILFTFFYINKKKISIIYFFNEQKLSIKRLISLILKYYMQYLGIILLLSICVFCILSLIKLFDHNFFNQMYSEIVNSNSKPFFEHLKYHRIRILNLLLLIPLYEEVFFRRFIFWSMRKNFKFVTSMIISSIIFTVFHIDKLILVFMASIFLCYIFEKEKNLLINVIIHSLINLTFLLTSI